MLLSDVPWTCPRKTDLPFRDGEMIEWLGADSLPPFIKIETEPRNSLLCDEDNFNEKNIDARI